MLVRSFSALDLSVLAALELVDPALDEPGYRPQQHELRQRCRWCGQDIGAIREVVPAAELVARFKRECA